MNSYENRLDFLSKAEYSRCCSTFYVEKNKDLDVKMFFLASINLQPTKNFSKIEEADAFSIINTSNFIASWIEYGTNFSQKIFNHLLKDSFFIPQIIPNLLRICKSIGNSWIFSAIQQICFQDFAFIQNALKNSLNFPTWDFIISEIQNDLDSKRAQISIPYVDRSVSFLYEAFLFSWPTVASSNVSSTDLATNFAKFLIQNPNSITIRLLNFLMIDFSSEIITLYSNIDDELIHKSLNIYENHFSFNNSYNSISSCDLFKMMNEDNSPQKNSFTEEARHYFNSKTQKFVF